MDKEQKHEVLGIGMTVNIKHGYMLVLTLINLVNCSLCWKFVFLDLGLLYKKYGNLMDRW